jgi:zinc D-Ala-D-Ala carboxypeptidase
MAYFWRWKNFKPVEVLSTVGLEQFQKGNWLIQPSAMDALQGFRNKLDLPIIITSGYRSPAENKAVGGAYLSRHVQGIAFDIRCPDISLDALYQEAIAWVLFGAIGISYHGNFVHVDTRPRVNDKPIKFTY